MSAAVVRCDVVLACPCGCEIELDGLRAEDLNCHVSIPCNDCGLRVGAFVSIDADAREDNA